MRARVVALLCAAAPLVTGCAATMTTAGSLRAEHAKSSTAAAVEELRVSPVATLRTSRRADAVTVEIAPLVTLGGTSASRLRLRASTHWNGRGTFHPSLKASLDEGQARASELMGDTIAPVPTVALVRAQALRASAGVRYEQGGRLRINARFDAEHSGGLGASASLLPQLSVLRLDAGARYAPTRRLAFEAISRLSSERTGDALALKVARASGVVSARLSAASSVFASAGLVEIVGGAAASRLPSLELGASYTPHGSALVPGVSFGGTLQSAADRDGFPQRVVRNGDASFAIVIARGKTLNIGVARFQQYSSGSMTNRETRGVLQFTLAPTR
ncbi:MAG: hypothetical protein NTW72_13605 [Gemmatimonadetes bacterium]|nr:hypothetical protein [Gemmatimonadota bacterium]